MESNNSLNKTVERKPSHKSHNLQCLYINDMSTRNKQEELEILTQEGNYDLLSINETWWDDSHDWNTANFWI